MAEKLQTRCVIAGGGPAGIMTGYLLARAGVPVIVLEKHADFFRDFRGDTIHPSTLELMYELGLLDEFLKQPHQEVRELRAVINGQTVPIADFTKLPTRCKFIAFMPQWDFLNFLSTHAKQFPSFQLLMEHEVVDLMFDQQRVTGVRAKTSAGRIGNSCRPDHRRRRTAFNRSGVAPGWSDKSSASRSTCSGCGSQRSRTILSNHSASFNKANCSCYSTAVITGSAAS